MEHQNMPIHDAIILCLELIEDMLFNHLTTTHDATSGRVAIIKRPFIVMQASLPASSIVHRIAYPINKSFGPR